MADEERTSETEDTSSNSKPETVDDRNASPAKESSEVNAEEQRKSSSRDEVGRSSEKSPTRGGSEENRKSRTKSVEEDREETVKRVEREEKIEVQETQETVTEEVGHRESNVESTEAVEIEEQVDVKPSESPVEQQSPERSPEVEVLKPLESEKVEPVSPEEYEPLPEYLPELLSDVDEPENETTTYVEEETAERYPALARGDREREVPERSPQRTAVVEERLEGSPLSVGESIIVAEKRPIRVEKSPYRSDSLGRTEREETPGEKRVKLSTGEIRIPNLKAQLTNIIRETEEQMEAPPEEDYYQEVGEDGQVNHTWKPKGKYDLAQTPVVREEVVPIAVDEVPEPLPLELGDFAGSFPEGDSQQLQEYDQLLTDGSGTITIQSMMPNGAPGSPIEIPEGIPLLARILPKEEDSHRERIPLERLFTPATDSGDITPRKKKAFASSDFYAPDHPTIDDQLQLAQRISGSLVDQTNNTSRGQAMYEKRKQRSEKWIHTAQSSEIFSINDSTPKTKPTTRLVMNPKGVQDHTTVEQHYEQLMQESSSSSGAPHLPGPALHIPASPEIAKEIINDMQSPTGKGAALFAKRKKRMDKFIVDETNVQRSSAYQQQSVVNSSFEQSFTNQQSSFSSSSTSSSGGVQQLPSAPAAPGITAPPGSKKRLQQERDAEQQKIMSEFLNKRESQFQIIKSPWEAALEGNTASAFKQNTSVSKISSSYSSSSSVGSGGPPAWLEGPKPVPVTAPLPKSSAAAGLPTPPSPFARPAANAAPPASPAFKPGAPAPAVPAFVPAAATPAFVPGASSGNPAPSFGNQSAGFAPPAGHGNLIGGQAAANPAFAHQFTPRGVGSPSLADKRKSANFNQAASGYGTYNAYYRPTSFASS